MSKKSGIIVLMLIGILLTFYFWNKARSNSREEVDKIKIGMVTFPGYAPLYLAEEKGFFENVDVQLVRIEAIGDLRSAMNSGNIDMYIATPDIFQSTQTQEPPGTGFLAIDESFGADGIAVTKDVNSMADLKGKKLGAEPGFPPYFILQYMLNEDGMTLSDIDFKDISSQDAGNAFVAKQLDAVGTYEPYLSKSVELRENSKILISSSDLKGLIVDIIFANDDLAKNKPEVLKAVADGWFKAVEYYESNKDESMLIMANAFGVSKEEMIEIKSGLSWLNLDENKNLFKKSNAHNIYTTFNLVGDILEKNNSNDARVDAADKLTTNIIKLYE
ncbi:ABC transporter substrate-binding protein [Flagellimonas myxillae]|uniref:ABC transporter substrate-binding protein n=1 Tax=Flagellimonas myxillae TaxID=2942214 RepID=UPI00201EFE7A|nr:ABC transporter substrate-binding protein [Muricauda myxillae]MCL6268153.1 ABC transporter substrate-binding protein [Muricauda myxillae]